jgi:hypothetical protein
MSVMPTQFVTTVPSSEFDAIWSESVYRFQVVYPPSRQAKLNAVLGAAGWNVSSTYAHAIHWEQSQMATADFQNSGSWIWYNAYADIAFDDAQLGKYRLAEAALVSARRQGMNATVIGWDEQEIQLLEHHG